MSCLDELTALAQEDLFDFILNADAAQSESQEENNLLENSHPPVPQLWDREMEDFIRCMLNPFEDESDMMQDYLPLESYISISEDQHQPYSFGSSFAGSLESSEVLQLDHNYSLHDNNLVLENMRSEMAEGGVSTDLEKQMDWEDTSKPQIPKLVLAEKEEQRRNLDKEGVSSPTCLLQPMAEDQLLEKARSKTRRKKSACSSDRRRKTYVKKRAGRNAGLAERMEPAKLIGSKSSPEAQAGEEGAAAAEEQPVTAQAAEKTAGRDTGRRKKRCRSRRRRVLCVLPWQVCKFPNYVPPDMPEDAVLGGFSPDAEDPPLSDSLDQ